MSQILTTAEPFLLLGDPLQPACLLIHGFTGAPKEMRWMGEYLNRRGYTCLGIRLAGHATDIRDMVRSRWIDWTASVEDGYHLLRGATDRIFLVGLSMGGILSLLMSTRLEAQGVVAMSTPYELPVSYPAWLLRAISLFQAYRKKEKGNPGQNWFDKEAFAAHVSYPLNPLRSAAELQVLLEQMRLALPKINVPVLLIHSRDDSYVPPENMPRIHERLGTRDKEIMWVTGSGHVVTRDAARERVFEAAAAFLQRVGKSPQP